VIERLWRGWTAPADADAYEDLLREELLPGAVDDVDGCVGYALSRRRPEDTRADEDDTRADEEVEFRTRIRFESMDAVRAFAGDDDAPDDATDDALAPHERAHVPPAARALLVRWEDRATHYDLRVERGD
jgi:hypothetical protein